MFENEIAKRILEWKNGEKIGPFEVQFNPTNRCNLKCKFCWLRDFDKSGANYEELSMKKYKEMINEGWAKQTAIFMGVICHTLNF